MNSTHPPELAITIGSAERPDLCWTVSLPPGSECLAHWSPQRTTRVLRLLSDEQTEHSAEVMVQSVRIGDVEQLPPEVWGLPLRALLDTLIPLQFDIVTPGLLLTLKLWNPTNERETMNVRLEVEEAY